MIFLKQSTASQSVLIGPFVDSTDGVTAETGLTIANTDIRLSKAGGNMAAKNSGGATHDEAGWYTITLDATDSNTVGSLQVSVAVSGALPVFAEFQVLEEAVYDALFASGATGPSTHDAAAVYTAFGTGSNLTALTTATGFSTHSAADVATQLGTGSGFTAIPWNSAWDAEVESEVNDALVAYNAVATTDLPTNFGDLAISVTTGQVTVGTNNDKTGYTLSASGLTAVETTVDGVIAGYGLDETNTTANAIKAVTDTLSTGAIADAVLTEIVTDHVGVSGSLAAYIGTISSLVTGIKTTTDTLSISAISTGVVDEFTGGDHQTGTTLGVVLSQTQFDSSGITIDHADQFKGWRVRFTGGTASGQVALITGHTGTGVFTVAPAMAVAPAASDPFKLIPGACNEKSDDIDSISTAISDMRGADSDTLKSLSDQIDGIATGSSPQLLQQTTIATVTSQTEFTLTAGSADDDSYNDAVAIFTDQVSSNQKAFESISDYTGATRTVTLSSAPAFTIAVGDSVALVATGSSSSGGSTGGGSVSHTVTIRTTAGDPIPNARVWLTADELGTVRRSGDLFTNDDGEVTFTINLDVTYRLWADDGGINEYDNPQTLLVSS